MHQDFVVCKHAMHERSASAAVAVRKGVDCLELRVENRFFGHGRNVLSHPELN